MNSRRIRLEGFPGAALLEKEAPELFNRKGGLLVLARQDGTVSGCAASKTADGFSVRYARASDLLCCLGDIVADDVSAGGAASSPAFKFRGAMIDCSRNAVPTIPFLRKTIVKLALLGFNELCLYTEDVYEVEGEPLIGFGRGSYSQRELRELDAFAGELGVEMFPCIQTLGHLQEILKFSKFSALCDNNSVLNVNAPDAEAFLRKLIENAIKPYCGKLIHLGSDEPWGLGRGKSLDFDKPQKPDALYAKHVARVGSICDELGLQPIIWADCLTGASGVSSLDEAQRARLPEKIVLNYWKYWSLDHKEYERELASLALAGRPEIVSPSVWASNRFLPHSGLAMKEAAGLMRAAYAKGVDMAMDTIWADDGGESFFDGNWPALAHFAAWCRKPEPSDDFWGRRSERICGIPAERAALLAAMQNHETHRKTGLFYLNVLKPLFYDDPFLGLCGLCVKGLNLDKTFLKLSEKAALEKPVSAADSKLLKQVEFLGRVAGGKLELLENARAAIRSGERGKFKKFAERARALAREVRRFRSLFSTLWLAERKPFGLEVVETRLAGVESRLETFSRTARAYASGKLDDIPGLRLEKPEGLKPEGLYAKAVSPCPLSNNRNLF